VHRAGRGEAGIFGVDEDDAPEAVNRHFVDVDIADGERDARDIDAIEMVVGHFIAAQDVLQPPDLREAPDQQAIALSAYAHGAHEILLIEGDPLVLSQADEEELTGLVGGEGEAGARRSHPIGKGARNRKPGLLLRLLRGALDRRSILAGLLDGDAATLRPPLGRRSGRLRLRFFCHFSRAPMGNWVG